MIVLERDAVAAGEAIRGSWVGAGGDDDAAWLVWRVVALNNAMLADGGRAIEDYRVQGSCSLPPQSKGAFEFRIPATGPCTHDGQLFRLVWEIVVGTRSGKISVAERKSLVVRARP